jgi:hypothetical protein
LEALHQTLKPCEANKTEDTSLLQYVVQESINLVLSLKRNTQIPKLQSSPEEETDQ